MLDSLSPFKQNAMQWVTLTFDFAFRWAFRWTKVRSKAVFTLRSTRDTGRHNDTGRCRPVSSDVVCSVNIA